MLPNCAVVATGLAHGDVRVLPRQAPGGGGWEDEELLPGVLGLVLVSLRLGGSQFVLEYPRSWGGQAAGSRRNFVRLPKPDDQ